MTATFRSHSPLGVLVVGSAKGASFLKKMLENRMISENAQGENGISTKKFAQGLCGANTLARSCCSRSRPLSSNNPDLQLPMPIPIRSSYQPDQSSQS